MNSMLTPEIWRYVREFPTYQVSNLGYVRHARIGRLLRQRTDRYGYLKVLLTNSGGQFWYYVDEMVAKHFLPDYVKGCRIEHLDGNTQYNAVENLRCVIEEEWKTIPDFPDYQVSSQGRIRNAFTERLVRETLGGSVSLYERGVEYRRSVNKIFRESFGR